MQLTSDLRLDIAGQDTAIRGLPYAAQLQDAKVQNRLSANALPGHAAQFQALRVDRLAGRLGYAAAQRDAPLAILRITHEGHPLTQITVGLLELRPFALGQIAVAEYRSEERRVGKECRSGWS